MDKTGDTKHSSFLLVARLGESLKCIRLLKPFVGKEIMGFNEKLDTTIKSIYSKWTRIIMEKHMQVLEHELKEEPWEFPDSWKSLHGGWDYVELALDDIEDDQKEGLDHGASEKVSLPIAATPAVMVLAFSIIKAALSLGDIANFKQLESLTVSSLGGILSSDVSELFATADASEFSRNEAVEKDCFKMFQKSKENCMELLATLALESMVRVWTKV
jgi:hypothetical protein